MIHGRRLPAALAWVLTCACVTAGGAAGVASDVATYDELVRAARRDATSVDYAQLRNAWTRSQEYDPLYRESAEFTKLFDALRAIAMSADEGANSHCASIPNRIFTDTLIHGLCGNLAGATGDLDRKRFHSAIVDGLLRSIAGHDGPVRGSREITVVSAYEQLEYLKLSPFRIVDPPGQDAAHAREVQVVNEYSEKATLRFVRHPAFVSHTQSR